MRRVLLLSLVLAATPASAHLNAINPSLFGNQPDVAECGNEVYQVEAYAAYWSIKWEHPVPRAQVLATLQRCRDVVVEARKTDPIGELALLNGLLEAYLHNFDEPGAIGRARAAFADARRAEPADTRADWLEGNMLAGAGLALEAIALFKKLDAAQPAGGPIWVPFWSDYARATHSAGMPASTLRALGMMEKGGAKLGVNDKILRDYDRKLLLPAKPKKGYEVKEVFARGEDADGLRPIFIWPYGLSLRVRLGWRALPALGDPGVASLMIEAPDVATPQGPVISTILVMADAQPSKESLEEYIDLGPSDYKFTRQTDYACPVPGCIAYFGLNTACKAEKGFNCTVFVVGFEREAPEFPGAAIEVPITLPKGETGEYTVLTPIARLDRFPGRIRYRLMFEVPEHGHAAARAQFDAMLKTLVVE